MPESFRNDVERVYGLLEGRAKGWRNEFKTLDFKIRDYKKYLPGSSSDPEPDTQRVTRSSLRTYRDEHGQTALVLNPPTRTDSLSIQRDYKLSQQLQLVHSSMNGVRNTMDGLCKTMDRLHNIVGDMELYMANKGYI